MKPYPVFLIGLDKRRCVVLGGGPEAQRKVDGLLECDAAITLIAPEITPELAALTAAGRLTHLARDYRKGDLAGAFLVIATDPDPRTVPRIFEEARTEGALVNVLDDTAHCNFVAGSVVRQGPLTLAISTSGAAPALAVRLRQRLERSLGPEYATLLGMLASLRRPLTRRYPDPQERKRIWYELVDSAALDDLRANRPELARRRLLEIAGLSRAGLRRPVATRGSVVRPR